MFKHPDRPLEGDEFLRTSALTSAAALTLPIPSVSV
jgi:hypothetical protein